MGGRGAYSAGGFLRKSGKGYIVKYKDTATGKIKTFSYKTAGTDNKEGKTVRVLTKAAAQSALQKIKAANARQAQATGSKYADYQRKSRTKAGKAKKQRAADRAIDKSTKAQEDKE